MRGFRCFAVAAATLTLVGCKTAEERAAEAVAENQRIANRAIEVCRSMGHTTDEALLACGQQFIHAYHAEQRDRSARWRAFGNALADGFDAAAAGYASAARDVPQSIRCRSVYVGQGITRTTCN